MLYQLSHVRMPVPSNAGRSAESLRRCVQNCIRSWLNHQLRTEGRAKNLSLERTLLTPSPPLPQVSPVTPVARAPQRRRVTRVMPGPDAPASHEGTPAPDGVSPTP